MREVVLNTKLRFWQFSLTSAILMMLSAGALLLVNFQEHRDVNMEPSGLTTGWPFPIIYSYPSENIYPIVENLIFAAAIVLAIGVASRRLIRHRCHGFTTCVFMVVAGLMLWANTIDVHTKRYYQHLERGWPFAFYTSWTNHEEGIVYGSLLHLFFNVLIASIIVFGAAFGCELLFRLSKRLVPMTHEPHLQ